MDVGSLLTGGSGIGIAWGVVQLISNRRKLGADTNAVDAQTAAVLTEAAREMVQPLRDQIKDLRAEIADLKSEVADARAKLATAMSELDAAHDINRAKDDVIHRLSQPQPPPDDTPVPPS